MKLRLLLCGAALMFVAGCATHENAFSDSSGQMYNYDLVPEVLPDASPAELTRIFPYGTPPANGPVNTNATGYSIDGR